MKHRLSARLASFSILLILLLTLSVQHLLSNEAGLRRNITMTRLLKMVMMLSPTRAEELVGLQQRPRCEFPALEMGLVMNLDDHSPLPGAILALLGQPVEAQNWLQSHAIAGGLAPFWLALSLGQLHQADEAIQALPGLSGIDQYFAQAGLVAQNAGRFEQASSLLEVAANLDNGQILYRSLVYEYLAKNAYGYGNMHDWDKSFYWADRWIQAAPNNTYAYTWLGALYLWYGDPEQAYAALQRARPYGVEQNPDYPGEMGQIYQARGQWELAIENYRKSWELKKGDAYMRPFIAWNLGFALFHQNHWDEAKPYLQIAAQSGIQPAAEILTQMDAGGLR